MENWCLLKCEGIIVENKSKFLEGHLTNSQLSTLMVFFYTSYNILFIYIYISYYINNNLIRPIEIIDQNGLKWEGHCNLNDAFLVPVYNTSKQNTIFCDI